MAENPDAGRRRRGRPWGLAFPALLCAAIVTASLVCLHPRPRAPVDSEESSNVLVLGHTPVPPMRLFMFSPSPAKDLVVLLDAAWALPRVENAVPNLALERLPEGVERLDTDARKRMFFRSVAPYILAENRRIRSLRKRLGEVQQRLTSGLSPGQEELSFVGRLAEEYRVRVDDADLERAGADALVEELLDRVDVVPPSLALAQAAIESGWGGSRFARLGNALFGQWVFAADRGLAPLFRPEGQSYAVARFASVAQAVTAYVRNLNTLWAYEDFRARRHQMRAAGTVLDPHDLAEGLRLYSERRDEYVAEVRQVMRNNRLVRFDVRRLAPVAEGVWLRVLDEHGMPSTVRSVLLPE